MTKKIFIKNSCLLAIILLNSKLCASELKKDFANKTSFYYKTKSKKIYKKKQDFVINKDSLKMSARSTFTPPLFFYPTSLQADTKASLTKSSSVKKEDFSKQDTSLNKSSKDTHAQEAPQDLIVELKGTFDKKEDEVKLIYTKPRTYVNFSGVIKNYYYINTPQSNPDKLGSKITPMIFGLVNKQGISTVYGTIQLGATLRENKSLKPLTTISKADAGKSAISGEYYGVGEYGDLDYAHGYIKVNSFAKAGDIDEKSVLPTPISTPPSTQPDTQINTKPTKPQEKPDTSADVKPDLKPDANLQDNPTDKTTSKNTNIIDKSWSPSKGARLAFIKKALQKSIQTSKADAKEVKKEEISRKTQANTKLPLEEKEKNKEANKAKPLKEKPQIALDGSVSLRLSATGVMAKNFDANFGWIRAKLVAKSANINAKNANYVDSQVEAISCANALFGSHLKANFGLLDAKLELSSGDVTANASLPGMNVGTIRVLNSANAITGPLARLDYNAGKLRADFKLSPGNTHGQAGQNAVVIASGNAACAQIELNEGLLHSGGANESDLDGIKGIQAVFFSNNAVVGNLGVNNGRVFTAKTFTSKKNSAFFSTNAVVGDVRLNRGILLGDKYGESGQIACGMGVASVLSPSLHLTNIGTIRGKSAILVRKDTQGYVDNYGIMSASHGNKIISSTSKHHAISKDLVHKNYGLELYWGDTNKDDYNIVFDKPDNIVRLHHKNIHILNRGVNKKNPLPLKMSEVKTHGVLKNKGENLLVNEITGFRVDENAYLKNSGINGLIDGTLTFDDKGEPINDESSALKIDPGKVLVLDSSIVNVKINDKDSHSYDPTPGKKGSNLILTNHSIINADISLKHGNSNLIITDASILNGNLRTYSNNEFIAFVNGALLNSSSVYLGGGDDTLVFDNTAYINGNIDGGSGEDKLVLIDSKANTSLPSSKLPPIRLIQNIQGFETLIFKTKVLLYANTNILNAKKIIIAKGQSIARINPMKTNASGQVIGTAFAKSAAKISVQEGAQLMLDLNGMGRNDSGTLADCARNGGNNCNINLVKSYMNAKEMNRFEAKQNDLLVTNDSQLSASVDEKDGHVIQIRAAKSILPHYDDPYADTKEESISPDDETDSGGSGGGSDSSHDSGSSGGSNDGSSHDGSSDGGNFDGSSGDDHGSNNHSDSNTPDNSSGSSSSSGSSGGSSSSSHPSDHSSSQNTDKNESPKPPIKPAISKAYYTKLNAIYKAILSAHKLGVLAPTTKLDDKDLAHAKAGLLLLMDEVYSNAPYVYSFKMSEDLSYFMQDASLLPKKRAKSGEWLLHSSGLLRGSKSYDYSQGLGLYGYDVGSKNERTKSYVAGGLLGLEYGLNDAASLGFILGSAHAQANFHSREKIRQNALYLGLYTKASSGHAIYRAGLGWMKSYFDAKRIMANAYQLGKSRAKYGAFALDAYALAGYEISLNEAYKITPVLKASYLYTSQDALAENTEPNAINMGVNKISSPLGTLEARLDFSHKAKLTSGLWVNTASLGVIKYLGSKMIGANAYILGSGANSFGLKALKQGTLAGKISLQSSLFMGSFELFARASYELEKAGLGQNLGLSMGLAWEF